jgi:hypothetical protein
MLKNIHTTQMNAGARFGKQIMKSVPYSSLYSSNNNGQDDRTIDDASAQFNIFGNPPSRTW